MEMASVCLEIEQLRSATVRELRTKYFELFGQPSRSNHKQFLFRRIAWRLQALAYGELSEQVRQQALALAQDADLRIKALICSPSQRDTWSAPPNRSWSRH